MSKKISISKRSVLKAIRSPKISPLEKASLIKIAKAKGWL